MPGMAAFKKSITLLQGETFAQSFAWRAGTPPVPVDLTGCTARMHVRASVASPDVLLSLSTDDGRITLGGPLGTIALRLPADVTAALSFVAAVYDLELVHPDGTVRRLLAGQVKLSPEVTRA